MGLEPGMFPNLPQRGPMMNYLRQLKVLMLITQCSPAH